MRIGTLMGAVRTPGRALTAVGAAVLLGGLAAGCGSSGDEAGAASAEAAATTAAESSGAPTAEQNRQLLASAMGGGDIVVCEFTESGTAGKMFVQGKSKFRFEGQSEEGPIRMVRDADKLYMWEPSATSGLVIGVASEDSSGDVISPVDLDEGMVDNLACEKYTGDMALMGAPADVTFTSLEDLMGGALDAQQLDGILNGADGAGPAN